LICPVCGSHIVVSRKKGGGRKPVLRRCRQCGEPMGAVQLRKHEPKCDGTRPPKECGETFPFPGLAPEK
jgi:DNA-directed RNA polymerase subunit M/transcription elongation factor TFIIS